jgi:hypothetical protein
VAIAASIHESRMEIMSKKYQVTAPEIYTITEDTLLSWANDELANQGMSCDWEITPEKAVEIVNASEDTHVELLTDGDEDATESCDEDSYALDSDWHDIDVVGRF